MTQSITEAVDRPAVTGGTDDDAVVSLLESALRYARTRSYAGYDYCDGLSSPFRRLSPGGNRWFNIILQESAKRAPINIRPALLIPKRRSFKGCGIFAAAEHRLWRLTNDRSAKHRVSSLLEWLWDQRQEDPFGWGHNHDIQSLDRLVPRNTPNIVTVSYVARTVLEIGPNGHEALYHSMNTQVPAFILDSLLVETPDGPRLQYQPGDGTDSFVLNANALGGSLLVELGCHFGRPELCEVGESLLAYVVSRQSALGGWTYADPANASHLSMDNHHNGFIIESLLRYRRLTGQTRFDESIEAGLSFYRNVLFAETGAPNWDETASYPRDIHAAAQGIITFAEAGDRAMAKQIVTWVREHLYGGAGAFYYREGRAMTRRFTLMRWCQAWMAYALSRLGLERRDRSIAAPRPTGTLVPR